jgi:hypothetical protein
MAREKSSRFYVELSGQSKYVCSTPNLFFEIKFFPPIHKGFCSHVGF